MKKPILFFLFVSILQSGLAQDAFGLLRVEVTPGSAWVKVDTVLIKTLPRQFPTLSIQASARNAPH